MPIANGTPPDPAGDLGDVELDAQESIEGPFDNDLEHVGIQTGKPLNSSTTWRDAILDLIRTQNCEDRRRFSRLDIEAGEAQDGDERRLIGRCPFRLECRPVKAPDVLRRVPEQASRAERQLSRMRCLKPASQKSPRCCRL